LVAQQRRLRIGRLFGVSTPQTIRHAHPEGHLGMSDEPVAEAATYTTHTTDVHPYPQRGSNPRSHKSDRFRRKP